MAALIGNYNHYLNMIRDVTGINSARDGSSPNPDALVGVQKLAALSSNTATRHILNAGLYATRRLAECVSLRIGDILQYADFKEEFAMQIGKYNVAILDEIKDLYLYDFGIFIEIAPDEEEKQMLEANINIALQQQTIDLEDAIDIRGMSNIKLANEMLKVKRRRRMDQQQKQKQQEVQMQTQSNMQTQQAAAQQKSQMIQLETQAKLQVKQSEAMLEIEKMNAEVEAKRYLMDLEFQYNMQLKGIEAESLMTREDNREKSKSERISQQNTEQSKLINQRKNNLPPQNFESTEDTLDGFDLSSFGPK